MVDCVCIGIMGKSKRRKLECSIGGVTRPKITHWIIYKYVHLGIALDARSYLGPFRYVAK